jgi:hypothetical protein
MSLPIRTTLEDVIALCNYFATKPTGATLADAKKVLDSEILHGMKISAMKSWGILEEVGDRFKILEIGRAIAKGNPEQQAAAYAKIIGKIQPYSAVIERAAHRTEEAITATEVAAHWHEHFPSEVTDSDKVLNDQAVCFFRLAEGAGFGQLVVGRKGSPTRFTFNQAAISKFTGHEPVVETDASKEPAGPPTTGAAHPQRSGAGAPSANTQLGQQLGQAIFIAHGKNKKPVEQLKKILDQFKIPYKVAVEEPNLGRPIGAKVKETMALCNCAILVFTADEEFKSAQGQTIWRPSENVVYELGASGYLYDNRLVIMKEEEVSFPSNFRDLGYISFAKDNLKIST